MGLINDMVKDGDFYAKNDLILFARETSGPREGKDYCFMGRLVDDRKNIFNVLTGEMCKNYSYYFPMTINKDGVAFYSVKKTHYRDAKKTEWFRLDTYDEDSVINGLIFAKVEDGNVAIFDNMVNTEEYYAGGFSYISIDGIKGMVNEVNEKIHQTLLERQKITEELEEKREQYKKMLMGDLSKN